jgi:hypothetical protein
MEGIDFLYQREGLLASNSPVDAYGNIVPTNQPYFVGVVQVVNGVANESIYPNPTYKKPSNTSSSASGVSAAPPAPQNIFTFDTIGQTIFRSIGHCRLPLRTIWAQGINSSGDETTSNTQTFAAALCAPIDPDEFGTIFAIWDGGNMVFDGSAALSPTGWTPEDSALLAASMASVILYPGDESQLPAPLIVADKGADKTNAFRGLRYLVFQNYPINGGGRGGGGAIPQLSVGFARTSAPSTSGDGDAVEFSTGSS